MMSDKSKRMNPWLYILLVIPYIGTLIPSFYLSAKPTLWGFPYYYWYQIMWIFLGAILTGIVYLADSSTRG